MSAGKDFVTESYEAELEMFLEEHEESRNVPFSGRIDSNTAALLDGLAQRFKVSRNSIVSQFLRAEAINAFQNLKPEDRLSVADISDSVFQSLMKKAGVESSSGGFHRLATYYNNCDAGRSGRDSGEVSA